MRRFLCWGITGWIVYDETWFHCCTALSDLGFSFSYEITLYRLELALISVGIILLVRSSIHTFTTNFQRLRNNKVGNVHCKKWSMHSTPLVEYMTPWKWQLHQNMCGRHFTVTYIIPYHILSVTFNVKSRSSHDKPTRSVLEYVWSTR